MMTLIFLYLWGQNVIFNPGFDMTPWDTGWTIEIDTFTHLGYFAHSKIIAEAKNGIGLTPLNSCSLYTSNHLYYNGGSSTWGAQLMQKYRGLGFIHFLIWILVV